VPDTIEGDLAVVHRLLSREEAVRYQRFKVARARRDFLAGRALVRATLSRYADVEPAAWCFRINGHGRPEIAGPPISAASPGPAAEAEGPPPGRARRLRFNLSHSRGLMACVVTDGVDCGVDVEQVGRVREPLEIAEHFFAPSESASLRAASGPARQELFAALWTLKEAYIKARGRGVSLGLRRFAFTVPGDGSVRVRFDPELGDIESAWQFALSHPLPSHSLAVALRRGSGQDLALEVRSLAWRELVLATGHMVPP
jgi:4'-phosphopantetheinyl transferase